MRSYKHTYTLLLGAGLVLMATGASMPAPATSRPAADPTRAATIAAPATSVFRTVAAVKVDSGPADARAEREARVDAALSALSSEVGRLSHPDALRMAFEAYFAFRAAHPEQVRKPYLYFVDYGKSSGSKRGYVFDMEQLKLVEGPFTVAHGRGSSKARTGVPTRFSNRSGSATSSLGLYVAQETYGFTGKSGGVRYSSIGLRMRGVSGDFNDNARARGVVIHGAPYVTPSGSGRSEGCPAMEQARARRLIPKLAEGGMVFLFAPDSAWMGADPWVNG